MCPEAKCVKKRAQYTYGFLCVCKCKENDNEEEEEHVQKVGAHCSKHGYVHEKNILKYTEDLVQQKTKLC